MRRSTTFSFLAVSALAACAQPTGIETSPFQPSAEEPHSDLLVQQPMIRAGRGEPTLDARYGLAIELPMPEGPFVRFIEAVPLPIERVGERGLRNPALGRPRHYREFDMVGVSHGYLIDGGYNRALERNELYHAYVRSGLVVYVENSFGYAP